MTIVRGWPFRVETSGDVRSGGVAELVVSAPNLTEPPARDRLHLCVRSFAKLACCGGLSGNTIRPTVSSARLLTHSRPEAIGEEIIWKFSTVAIDPRGVSVLLNMLEGAELQIDVVRVRAAGRDGVGPLGVDEYPPCTDAIRFSLEYELTSRNVDVEVVFLGPLSTDLQEKVIDPLLTWRLVGILGGFRRADLEPLESNFFPVGEPEVILDALSFSLEKSTAHDGTFDSLVNVLVWISENLASIERVRIV